MSVKKLQSSARIVFFCTFTCYKWYHLFEIAKFYDGIYNWFNILIGKGNDILGYGVMPDHVHFLIHYPDSKITLYKVVGNGLRFMAYEIIKRISRMFVLPMPLPSPPMRLFFVRGGETRQLRIICMTLHRI